MAVDESALYELIGARIRAARERQAPKMSQSSLAKKVRLTRASIVNIEAGRQRSPIHVIWRIAEALGIEPFQLLPRQADLDQAAIPVKLDAAAIKKIEAAANGDVHTRRLLTQFVSSAVREGASNEQDS